MGLWSWLKSKVSTDATITKAVFDDQKPPDWDHLDGSIDRPGPKPLLDPIAQAHVQPPPVAQASCVLGPDCPICAPRREADDSH